MSAEDLLLRIARCESAAHCRRTGDISHPCFDVVDVQKLNSDEMFCLPEPWSGEIEKARLLFISSNPSIGSIPTVSPTEIYPTQTSSDKYIVDFFNGRFGSRGTPYIENGIKCLLDNGDYSRYIAFWSSVKARAKDIYEREVQPGLDYALTEVVHCKSQNEIGVAKARKYCAGLYLKKIVEHSVARVIMVMGVAARNSMLEFYRELDPVSSSLMGPLTLAGRKRLVLFSPHPNSRAERKLSKILSYEELLSVRSFIRESTHD